MALISYGELSCLFLLPIINAFLNFFNFEIYKITTFLNHPVVYCLICNLLLCILFIPLIFSKICCNSKNEKIVRRKQHKSSMVIKIKNNTMFMVITGLLFELVNIFHSIFSRKIGEKHIFLMNDYIFELLCIVIASKIFSKSLVYKHQQISIIFTFILGVGFVSIDLYINTYYRYILAFLILKQIVFGISVIFIKHITELKNYSILKMLFIFGISGVALDLFFLIITSNINCSGQLDGICATVKHNYENETHNFIYSYDPNITYLNISNYTQISEITKIKNITNVSNIIIDNFTNYTNFTIEYTNTSDKVEYFLDNLEMFIKHISDNSEKKLVNFTIINILYLIFSMVNIFLFIIIIQKLFPSYTYFINILLSIFSKIKELFYDKPNALFILIQIIIALFIFFWALVHNEIIELNFCGLNDDTLKNKLRRDDIDERRKSDWVTSKGIADADATLVDENNYNPESSGGYSNN